MACSVKLQKQPVFVALSKMIRAVLGIEPRTSRTLSDNHTARPHSHLKSGSHRVFDDSVWAKSVLVPFCSPFLPKSILD
jgi:hypothetical protein